MLREARVPLVDIGRVQDFLAHPPGGLDESPAAAEALELLDRAVARADEVRSWTVSDRAAGAIHWALESMMAEGLELTDALHDLRDVVELGGPDSL